jgi:hypothetical protein
VEGCSQAGREYTSNEAVKGANPHPERLDEGAARGLKGFHHPSSLNPSKFGQSVTFTAKVAAEFAGPVTGTVILWTERRL